MSIPAPASVRPSSAEEGFFQAKPSLDNQALEDTAWQRAYQLFLPPDLQSSLLPSLRSWGAHVLTPQVLAWGQAADSQPPYLRTWDTFGRRCDTLVTSEGWRQLQKLGLREGLVAIGHERRERHFSRLHQFLKYHLWTGSAALVTCPSAMQDGAATLLTRHVADDSLTPEDVKIVLKAALNRLRSRDDDAWTSGQWMTERAGGSDVRGTETRARKLPDEQSTTGVSSNGSPLGPWSVDGFKWFSSATDADCTVLLAKTGDSDHVSAFYAPVRCRASGPGSGLQYNGVVPQRLKNKLGTKPLPTAELTLKGMRAHMLGQPGQGTKEISTVLNITRVHNIVSAVGFWGRGLAISRAFARVRRVSGTILTDVPAHIKGLAAQHVAYRADMLSSFFIVYCLGVTEVSPSNGEKLAFLDGQDQAFHLLRLLTPVLKATTALNAIAGVRFCMESMGGVGYLENEDPELNVARLFRDVNVLAIWEGTTDIMAADTVRVLRGKMGKESIAALSSWINSAKQRGSAGSLKAVGLAWSSIDNELKRILVMIKNLTVQELLYRGRELLEGLSWILSAVMLIEDALRDQDTVAVECARRWIAQKDKELAEQLRRRGWKEEARLDRSIVFGEIASTAASKI